MKGAIRMVGNWKKAMSNCKWLRDDSDRAGGFEYCRKARKKVCCWGDEKMCEHAEFYEGVEE